MFLVIAYDITDDDRRRRVSETLENYGTRVQASVFECHLTPAQRTELQERILAHALTVKIYEVTASFPKEETFGLVSQMKRAASSIGMNLAEGAMRLNSREYRHFVGIARGSVAEVSYQLLLAKDLGYISPERYGELRSSYDRVGQMLTRLSQSLNHD